MFELPKGRISGRALAALVTAVRKTPARHLIVRMLREDLGIKAVRELPASARGVLPASVFPLRARLSRNRSSLNLPTARAPWPHPAETLTRAYREGRVDPVGVVEHALRAARVLAESTPSMGPFERFDDERAKLAAQAAKERYTRGAPLGPLDGVPVAIKEEVDVLGLPTRLGTSFLPDTPAAADCPAVARLREAGAVILGQTVMTEYGLSPLGGNPHRVMPRNVYSSGHLPGGSSTGSAVAVALGLTPVALGLDGGGSIRVPAAHSGVFGLKPTLGRIPLTGHGFGAGSSMTTIGPIGASPSDLALFMELCSGPDGVDATCDEAPALGSGQLVGALSRGVKGLRIGVDEHEWAQATDEVQGPGRRALAALEADGAELVSVSIPGAEHAPAIGFLTIGLESFAAASGARSDRMEELGYDVQLSLATMEGFEADDYLDAQRLRAKLKSDIAKLLRDVDVLALPTTAAVAPPITDAEARHGFVDPPALAATCRYVLLANVTGLPAGTAPVGANAAGLPVGIQFVADAWDEASVLQVLAHLERIECARVRRPHQSIDLLGTA